MNRSRLSLASEAACLTSSDCSVDATFRGPMRTTEQYGFVSQ
jgi:hypothetical protein